jgi:multicomponent Na+:H+ antiporter subunit A
MMIAIVLAGFVVAALAPWVHRASPRWGGLLLAVYPATSFGAFALGGAGGHERLIWSPSLGIDLTFAADGLSQLFALLITGIGTLVIIYAGAYMHGHPRHGRLYAYLIAFMASMLGIVLSDNVVAMFVFWELTSITSFLLIGFDHDRAEARAAALQALFVTAGGGLALLAGLLMLGSAAGSYELTRILEAGDTLRAHPLYVPIVLLVLAGAFTKSAQVPFHFWLPNAMEAPTPVSAYLHSSTMVKAGVYLMARLHPALGSTELWLLVVGGFGAATALTGAVLAYRQTDVKRILAFSTVSALGLMTMLIGIASNLALHAAALLILAHGLYKGALFLVAGTIAHETGERNIVRLGGLRGAMPISAAAGMLAALSMAGLPPLGGFMAKELMLDAALHAPGVGAVALWIALPTGMLLAAVAFITGFVPFIGRMPHAIAHTHEGGWALWIGAVLLALAGAVVGLVPAMFADPLTGQAAVAMGADPRTEALALWHGFTPVLLYSAITLAGAGVLIWRWRPFIESHAPKALGLGDRGYALALKGLNASATGQTRVLQSGYLRYYLLVTITVAIGAVGITLLRFEGGTGTLPLIGIPLYEAGLLVLILVSAVAAAASSSRLAAVAALGITGYGVALVFVTYGAPDLAMTQFVVETLTVILFLFAFYDLPAAQFGRREGGAWVRDALVAGGAGALMTVLILAATTVARDPISSYFIARSEPDAHGRNVVNVILVDFRALDTLGEISVLGLAGIGVFALLKLLPKAEGSRR